MQMHSLIAKAFFAGAAARGAYFFATDWTHGYDEVIVLALLGILAHFAFQPAAKVAG